MKYRTTLLVGTTWALASMTFLLARTVHRERVHEASSLSAPTLQATAHSPVITDGNAIANTREAADPASPDQGGSANDDMPPADLNKFARNRLRLLRDPEARRKLLAEALGRMASQYRGLDAYLGLSADEMQMLMHKLAERDLARMEQLLDCRVATPGCNQRAVREAFEAANPMETLFAPRQHERFEAFTDSNLERRPIERWAERLSPELALSAADSERLVATLREVRRQFEAEARQRGEQIDDYSNGLHLNTAAPPGGADRAARLTASANDYGRRLRQQAATLLSAGQLAAFNTELETTLARHKVFVEEREIRENARREAGIGP